MQASTPRNFWDGRADCTHADPAMPRRILLLRLEQVGDLVMVLEAIAMVRALAPNAAIDLVVGSWNRPLAGLIHSVTTLKHSTCRGLHAKGRACRGGALTGRARAWRNRGLRSRDQFRARHPQQSAARLVWGTSAAWDSSREAVALR